jgi:hypothetical protein
MSTDVNSPLSLEAAAFDRVREFASTHEIDLTNALALIVHRGVEAGDARDLVLERLDRVEESLRQLRELLEAGLGPRVFAVARLLAAREAMVTQGSMAEEDFLAGALRMGRHEWDGFAADLEAGRTRTTPR